MDYSQKLRQINNRYNPDSSVFLNISLTLTNKSGSWYFSVFLSPFLFPFTPIFILFLGSTIFRPQIVNKQQGMHGLHVDAPSRGR